MFDADYPTGDRYYFKGGFLPSVTEEIFDVARHHMERRPNGRGEFDLHHMGGAVDRVDAASSAFPGRGWQYMYNAIACWSDPAEDHVQREWVRAFADDLDRLGGHGRYVNFLSEAAPDVAAEAYGSEAGAGLRTLKRRLDPSNLFRLNQNITL
jgi:hypothetical protein